MYRTKILSREDWPEISIINNSLLLGICYFLLNFARNNSFFINAIIFEEIFFICILAETIFYLQHLYNDKLTSMFRNFFLKMGIILSICGIVILGLLAFRAPFATIQWILYDVRINYVALILLFLTLTHKPFAAKLNDFFSPQQRILIMGSGDLAYSVLRETNKFPAKKYQIIGIIPDKEIKHNCIPTELFMDNGKELNSIIKENKINKIITAPVQGKGFFPVEELISKKLHGIRVMEVHDFYEELTGKIHIQDIRPSWLVMTPKSKRNTSKDFWSAVFNSAIALTGLVLCFPLMVLIALLIKIDSSGPIFFKQKRVGYLGEIFVLYKFRTMFEDAEFKTGPVWAAKNDARITRVGKIIRKMRLDELPQMINVLKGEMNFIGPRPERPYFVNKLKEIIPYYTQRHIIKPGITGWAAVKYQYGATIEDSIQKLQYDFYYIKRSSIFLNLLIVILTIRVMLTGQGSR